ncbi:MAG: hypothetical protein IT512_12015 [Rhodocyclaceae bacterium]|nr:hypothetical protein [Rhodocyclaceae bacterium]
MANTRSPASGVVATWRKATRWREEQGGDVFPTQSSLDWFIREHFNDLIASGELIPGTGRRGHLVGPNFDEVALGILRGAAGRHAA